MTPLHYVRYSFTFVVFHLVLLCLARGVIAWFFKRFTGAERVWRRLQVQVPGGSSTGQSVSPPCKMTASGAMPGRVVPKRPTEKATLRRWRAARRPCWASPQNERARERTNERMNQRTNQRTIDTHRLRGKCP